MTYRFITSAALAAGLLSAPALAQTDLHYDDLRRFGAALVEIEAGADAEMAIAAYLDAASPGLAGYAARYQTEASSIAEQYARRPVYYGGLPELEAYLTGRQGEIDAALARLAELAPIGQPVDSYFFVADQTAGGTPVMMQTETGSRPVVAIAVDMIAMAPDTDMTEFPTGTGGRARAADLPQVVVHENAHVLQMFAQGGIENFRSIYSAEGGSMMAVAVREGCAEYVTYLASGWRLGDRHLYGEANEAQLWQAFSAIADAPPFSVPGWFGGTHADHPDYPPQIGYWVGFKVCEYHHLNATDPAAAIADLFTLYAPEDVASLARAYGASLALE